jgi:hypothetical protein
MKLITETVRKEKALYEVLTMTKIQLEISKRLKVLGSPVSVFGIACLSTWL